MLGFSPLAAFPQASTNEVVTLFWVDVTTIPTTWIKVA